jgi:hypothetical protein
MKISKRLLVCGLLLILILVLSGVAVAVASSDNPGKGSPDLSKIVFIHYPKGAMAEGGSLGVPGDGANASTFKGEKDWYKYSGIHWDNTSAAPVVPWVLEESDSGYIGAIEDAFSTWAAEANITFVEADDDVPRNFVVPSSYDKELSEEDQSNLTNEIAWISFAAAGLPDNAIGVTTIWYDPSTGLIVEVDMAMNADLSWVQNDIEPDEANTTLGESGYFDVQNIATHEAGHWLLLGDLYMKPELATEQTMYGYGALRELKKRSLESGDTAGAVEIYGEPPTPTTP